MKLFFKKIGEGRPIIILHGLFGLSDNWITVSKALAENGFCCYLVDARNHGRSDHSIDFSYELMAKDIYELLNDEEISAADIIGHSMGGKTAMFFAKSYPEKVRKMIVVDIAPRFYPQHHQTIISALKSFNPSDLTSRKEAEEILRIPIKDESTIQFLLKNLYWKGDEDLGLRTKENVQSVDSSILAWRFGLNEIEINIEEVGKEFDSEEELNTDILFIRGDRSGYIGDDDIVTIKTIFPRAKIETIAGAGHWVHAEQPIRFVDTVLAFLKN